MRRAQSLNPPAFLIDQDRGVGAAIDLTQGRRQPADLIGSLDVAGEKNEAPGSSTKE